MISIQTRDTVASLLLKLTRNKGRRIWTLINQFRKNNRLHFCLFPMFVCCQISFSDNAIFPSGAFCATLLAIWIRKKEDNKLSRPSSRQDTYLQRMRDKKRAKGCKKSNHRGQGRYRAQDFRTHIQPQLISVPQLGGTEFMPCSVRLTTRCLWETTT